MKKVTSHYLEAVSLYRLDDLLGFLILENLICRILVDCKYQKDRLILRVRVLEQYKLGIQLHCLFLNIVGLLPNKHRPKVEGPKMKFDS